jgi:hypothetical protein
MSFEFIDTEDYFVDGEVSIGGQAKVEISSDRYNDADIGGTDGWETHVELIHIDLRGVHISRNQLTEIFGKAHVEAFENRIAAQRAEGMAA